jgi:hypothetical protein
MEMRIPNGYKGGGVSVQRKGAGNSSQLKLSTGSVQIQMKGG